MSGVTERERDRQMKGEEHRDCMLDYEYVTPSCGATPGGVTVGVVGAVGWI